MSYSALGGWQVVDDAGRRKYVNDAERGRFLAAADDLGPELRALCYVLAFTGCRISEALGLTREHLDSERCALVIKSLKRRRLLFRSVPIPETLVGMLLALPPREDSRFFIAHRTTAWRRVRCVMRSVGIEGPMACPKGLRHGFGIRAAESAVPPGLIQKWLGHASGTTTAIYIDAVGVEERAFAGRMWDHRTDSRWR